MNAVAAKPVSATAGGPTAIPFRGRDFFDQLRPHMDKGRGMVYGKDGAVHFVGLDAVFYRFQPVTRDPILSLVSAALLRDKARVVTNAQFTREYHWVSPGPATGEGEIIADGTVSGTSYPHYWHLGEQAGTGAGAFAIEKGDPSKVPGPAKYRDALGGFIPLVIDSKLASSAQLGDWMTRDKRTGKVAFGLHRAAETVLVVVQENNGGQGALTAPELGARMCGMGVDRAVLGDGSDSVMLLIDGAVEIEPLFYKNFSLPTGADFTLQELHVWTDATLTNDQVFTTDSRFKDPFVADKVDGIAKLVDGGSRVVLDSLGNHPAYPTPEAFAGALEVKLPLELNCVSSKLTQAQDFTGTNTLASLTLKPNPVGDGEMVGYIQVMTSRGRVRMTAHWPVKGIIVS